MPTNYMNHNYLVQTEAVTAAEFAKNNPTAEAIMPELMDTLFRLTYFVEHQTPAPEDGVHFFAFERCLRFPYTLRSVWLLACTGHYPEAADVPPELRELPAGRYVVEAVEEERRP